MSNKKGSVIDMIIFIVFALVIVVFFSLWYYGFGLVNNVFSGMTQTVGNNVSISSIANDTVGNVYSGLSTLKILAWVLIVGMMLTIFVSNFLVKVHPVFFFVHFGMVVISIVCSVYVSNAYETLLTNTAFGGTMQSFTGGTFILLYLPYIVTVVGLMGMVFLMSGILRDNDLGGSPI